MTLNSLLTLKMISSKHPPSSMLSKVNNEIFCEIIKKQILTYALYAHYNKPSFQTNSTINKHSKRQI